MKKHSFKLMLIVLVLVLGLSTVLLAACGEKPENKPQEQTVSSATMLNEIIDKIASSVSFGEQLGVDVDAAFVIDDKTAANKDVTYRLTAKGNANGKQTAAENETNFAIELVKQEGTKKDILFGLAYEVIENEPFFFINIANSGYKKINGYSMASLYKMTQKNATVAADGGVDIVGLVIDAIVPMLFGDTGKVLNNTYTLNFSLYHTFTAIGDFKGVILGAIGMTDAQLDELIAQFFGELTYKTVDGKTHNVTSFNTLGEFLLRGMTFNGQLVFNFNSNDKFQNANLSFNYTDLNKSKDPAANYTFKVDKAEIGTPVATIDTFADFSMSADERKAATAFNLLNFSLKGTATGLDAKGEVAHTYKIEVQSDIDALELLNLVNGTDKANILATLERLGYFHLAIDEVFEDETKEPLNIITLHSKFDEGFAVINFHAYKAVLYNVGLGGVYDFDALIDVIGMLGEGGDDDATTEETNIIDTIKNVIDTVQDVLGYFTFDNMSTNGVTVELKNLVYMICGMAGIDTSGMTGMGLDAIVGNTTMNIKFASPTFGTCEKVDTNTIKCGIRETSSLNATDKNGAYDLSASRNSFIKEITSLDGFSGKLLQNDMTFAKYLDGYVTFDKAFLMKGIDLAGNEIQTSGFIMGVKGLDITKAGKQNVTLYIAIANDMLDFQRAGFSFGDLIPLFGTLKFETEIEVLEFDENAEITVSNIKTEDQTALVGGSKVFDLIRVKTYGATTEMDIANRGTFAIDLSMIKVFDDEIDGSDVTADVLDADGKFTQVGEYWVKIGFAGYFADACKVTVEDAYAVRADNKAEIESLELGGSWTFDEYKVFALGADGKSVEVTEIAPQYRIGSTTLKSLDEAFDIDGNTYTLKQNLDYVGKNFTIRFNNVPTASGLKKTVDVNIPIVSDYSIASNLSGISYFGTSISGLLKLNISEVVYDVVYKDAKWVAVAADGTEKEVEMTFTWNKTQTAVEFFEDGCIKNYPNENKSSTRSNRVDYTIVIDGYTYTYYFTAYELYASNKSSAKVGDTLNGSINNLNKIAYIDNEGNVQELEFKYGAEGYAIYIKDTDTKVIDVAVTVTKDGEDYTLTDGEFTETGKYNVTYSFTIIGVEQTFNHDITVK